MNRHWTLTDLEFVVRWDGQRSGVLPAPFVFTSDIRSYRAFETLKAETAERLSGDPATVPDDVLNIVARPDIRIIGSAWDPQHPNDPAKRIRLHAARRSGRGVLITQLPGRTIWHSGGFTITEHHELALADAVVAALPEARAGRLGEVALLAEGELDYRFAEPAHRPVDDDAPRKRAADFRDSVVDRLGVFEIAQGASLFGPRGITCHRIGWRDLHDDGRYLIRPGTPVVATPASRAHLADGLNHVIADVVRAIKDEQRCSQ